MKTKQKLVLNRKIWKLIRNNKFEDLLELVFLNIEKFNEKGKKEVLDWMLKNATIKVNKNK